MFRTSSEGCIPEKFLMCADEKGVLLPNPHLPIDDIVYSTTGMGD